MKVGIALTGGWMAGLVRNRPPLILDADSLSPDEREQLRSLVRESFAEARPQDDPARRAPGGFVITVEDGGPERRLAVADMDEERQPAASALRHWLQERLQAK